MELLNEKMYKIGRKEGSRTYANPTHKGIEHLFRDGGRNVRGLLTYHEDLTPDSIFFSHVGNHSLHAHYLSNAADDGRIPDAHMNIAAGRMIPINISKSRDPAINYTDAIGREHPAHAVYGVSEVSDMVNADDHAYRGHQEHGENLTDVFKQIHSKHGPKLQKMFAKALGTRGAKMADNGEGDEETRGRLLTPWDAGWMSSKRGEGSRPRCARCGDEGVDDSGDYCSACYAEENKSASKPKEPSAVHVQGMESAMRKPLQGADSKGIAWGWFRGGTEHYHFRSGGPEAPHPSNPPAIKYTAAGTQTRQRQKHQVEYDMGRPIKKDDRIYPLKRSKNSKLDAYKYPKDNNSKTMESLVEAALDATGVVDFGEKKNPTLVFTNPSFSTIKNDHPIGANRISMRGAVSYDPTGKPSNLYLWNGGPHIPTMRDVKHPDVEEERWIPINIAAVGARKRYGVSTLNDALGLRQEKPGVQRQKFYDMHLKHGKLLQDMFNKALGGPSHFMGYMTADADKKFDGKDEFYDKKIIASLPKLKLSDHDAAREAKEGDLNYYQFQKGGIEGMYKPDELKESIFYNNVTTVW